MDEESPHEEQNSQQHQHDDKRGQDAVSVGMVQNRPRVPCSIAVSSAIVDQLLTLAVVMGRHRLSFKAPPRQHNAGCPFDIVDLQARVRGSKFSGPLTCAVSKQSASFSSILQINVQLSLHQRPLA